MSARRIFFLGCAVALFSGVLVAFAGSPAVAHVRSSPGYGTLISDGSDVRFTLSLDYELLARAVGSGRRMLDTDHDVERARLLAAKSAPVGDYVAERVVVYLDEVACDSTLGRTGIERRQGSPYARLDITYACPGSSEGSYRIEYDVFSDTDAVVDDHTMVLDYRIAGADGRAVVDRSHRAVSVGDTSLLTATLRFVTLGVEHIVFGLDHVLFLVALMLGARGLRDVVTVASLFTVAHSITLALALLGWVQVPARLVEPLIALSIAFVALENLLGGPSRFRLAVIFGFGLMHGLGFAGSLQVSDDVSWNLVASLLSFNVGIELGQALLIAAVFPVLILLRRAAWSRIVYAAATAVVAGLGLIWFFERVALA